MTGEKKTAGFRLSKKAWIIIGIIVAAVLAVYIGVSVYYQGHFFRGSVVNNVNASNKTPAEIMQQVKTKAMDYSLNVKEENTTETLTPEDVGLKVENNEKDFQKLLKQQNAFTWPAGIFGHRKYESKVLVSYDKDKLTQSLNNLADVTNPNVIESQNAKVSYSNGTFQVENEVYGNHVDLDKLTTLAESAVTNLKKNIDLKKDSCYILPTLKADDKTLQKSAENLNKKMGMTYTYSGDGVSETIPKDTLAGFLSTDDKGNVTYNDDAIKSFVQSMESKYNTAGKPFTIKSSWGGTVTVPGGTYGYRINESKEIAQIKADLDAGKDVNRDFIYSQTASSHGTPSTYIEVNLTAQHMYVYKDGAQVLSSDVVTGNPNKEHQTHVGSYYIVGKQKNATLRGENYATPVSYWMPFHNGEGFHDASWQPSFGGTYYKIRGSHGCVNLPPSFAGTLYNTVSTGMPVFIYEKPGTENDTTNSTDAQKFVNDVNALVAAPITLDSEAAIQSLEKRYSKLTPEAKALVTNYAALQNARAQLDALKAQQQAAADAAAQQPAAQ